MEERFSKPLIGIIGGMGPYAGLDFMEKIMGNTIAVKDQEHLDSVLVSCPSLIPDRTEYLLASDNRENPAEGMFKCAQKLFAAGVKYAVVACNTAHARLIFEPFLKMTASLQGLQIINMLECCASHAAELGIRRIGLLATLGTHRSGVYREYFNGNLSLMEPDEEGQKRVHKAIYDTDYGIKAHSRPVTKRAKNTIKDEIENLSQAGAQAVILGCTELPFAAGEGKFSVPLIDPGTVAARRLISLAAPEKLAKL
jgi:aspartate racemase